MLFYSGAEWLLALLLHCYVRPEASLDRGSGLAWLKVVGGFNLPPLVYRRLENLHLLNRQARGRNP